MPRSIDAALFDLGGVIFNIDFGGMFARWATHCREEASTIQERFCFDEFYARHERGDISVDEYYRAVRRTLNVDLSQAEFIDGWNEIFLEEIAGMRDLLRSLASDIPLYAFTNSNPTHSAVWVKRYASILKNFRRIFISSDIGLRKPEAKAFRTISRLIGTLPARIVFFDDTKENVEGAAAVGMRGVHIPRDTPVVKTVSESLCGLL